MIDYKKLKDKGFQEWQIQEIQQCQKKDLNISDELITKYLCDVDNPDPEVLEKQLKLNNLQISEIRQGLVDGIDVDFYADYTIPAETMRSIRKKLNYEQGMHCEANDQFKLAEAKRINLDNKDHEKLHFSLVAMGIGMGALALVIAVLCIIILVLALKG